MTKLTHLSLFSGSGGIDLGFKWANIQTVAAVEVKEFACSTLKRNNPDIKIFGPPNYDGDIRNFNGKILKELIGDTEIDIISGGPPCQPFSVAASQRYYKNDKRYKRKGDLDENKGNLLPEFIRIINELKPKVFVIENVKSVITWNNGEFLSQSLNSLEDSYVFSTPCSIQSHKFGVPQYRERMIIIGTRIKGKKPVFNNNTIEINRIFTVDDALSNFPDNPFNHQLRDHNSETIERYKKLKYGERDQKGRVDKLDPNKPSKTVIAGGENGGGRSHLHPYYPRTTSPRECARFQTFPDDFVFEGTMSRQFTQIGNAVPPLLAYFIGSYIKKDLFEMEVNFHNDLSKIKHPVVKKLPENIRSFNINGKLFNEGNNQMNIFDFMPKGCIVND